MCDFFRENTKSSDSYLKLKQSFIFLYYFIYNLGFGNINSTNISKKHLLIYALILYSFR